MGALAKDIQSRSNVQNVYPEDVDVITEEGHPLYDPRCDTSRYPLDRAFIDQLKLKGVRTPIKCRRNTTTGRLEAVAGRRRTLHLRAANEELLATGGIRRTLPVIIVQFDDRQVIEEMVIENTREDEDTYSKAVKMRTALAAGYTEADICLMFRCSGNHVKEVLSVLDLPPEGQALLQQKRLAPSIAYGMQGKSQAEKRELLTRALAATGTGEVRGNAAREAVGQRKAMLGRRPILALLARTDLHPAARSALETVLAGTDWDIARLVQS